MSAQRVGKDGAFVPPPLEFKYNLKVGKYWSFSILHIANEINM